MAMQGKNVSAADSTRLEAMQTVAAQREAVAARAVGTFKSGQSTGAMANVRSLFKGAAWELTIWSTIESGAKLAKQLRR